MVNNLENIRQRENDRNPPDALLRMKISSLLSGNLDGQDLYLRERLILAVARRFLDGLDLRFEPIRSRFVRAVDVYGWTQAGASASCDNGLPGGIT